IPRVLGQQLVRLAARKAGFGSRTTGILPLRLARQTIPPSLEVISRQLHARAIFACRVGLVAPLVPTHPILVTQAIAIGRGIVPRQGDHRTIPRGGPVSHMGDIDIELIPVTESAELRHRYFFGSKGKTSVDLLLVPLLALAHPEFTRSRQQDHRL